MKTYLVIQDCVRMPFDRRRFRKDEVIELPDDVDPGSCFKQIDGPATKKEDVSTGMSLSEMQARQNDLVKPKSGFAASVGNEFPKKPGRPKKTTR